MFRVEITFKSDLEDVERYTSAVDEIFAKRNMPCVEREQFYRVYGDNGDPKDFGRLYASVGNVSRSGWILRGIGDAYFDNGRDRDTLMTNFFSEEKHGKSRDARYSF